MLLNISNLEKTFERGTQKVRALQGINLQVHQGEFVSIMGPSGSGKSTLLHLMGGLDRPTKGIVSIEDEPINQLSDEALSLFRRRKLGFIFQFFNLLPTLNALENVALPRLLDGESIDSIRPDALSLLEKMGLASRAYHRPDELSGGEMQRVAIARALVTRPLLILADEPTGNLDSKTGQSVLEQLRSMAKDEKKTIIMVTHDPSAAAYGTRLLKLKDGQIEEDRNLNS